VRPFFEASLAEYPAFVARLREVDPELAILAGLVQVSAAPGMASDSIRLDSTQVRALEPSISAPSGAVLHPRDGAIDNVRLTTALARAVDARRELTVTRGDPVTGLALGSGAVRVSARKAVLAAGAWSAAIDGLPRELPVHPLKGQMLAFESRCLSHSIAGDEIYLVPRDGEVVAGATVEHAGFDLTVHPAAIEGLRQAAVRLCPPLADARVVRTWAGIRPATPDMLPIIGADPDAAQLIYACGHSKNGILLAPATAVAVADLVQGLESRLDVRGFSIGRFG
jgi:glycine oxidase